jgi:hypothetical protein
MTVEREMAILARHATMHTQRTAIPQLPQYPLPYNRTLTLPMASIPRRLKHKYTFLVQLKQYNT